MYNSTNAATWLWAPPRISLRRNSTQRFVMYNATNAATWLWAPQRLVTRLRVLRRAATQLNDLFISFRASTRSDLARRVAAPRNATICLLLRDATWLIALLRSSAQLNDLFVTSRRSKALRFATQPFTLQRNSTICLSIYHRIATIRSATRLCAARRGSTHRNAIQRFVCQFIIASRRLVSCRSLALCSGTRRNATQRFVCKFIIACRPASQRVSSRLCSTQRFVCNSAPLLVSRQLSVPQLNDLFVNLSPLRSAALRNYTQLVAPPPHRGSTPHAAI